MRDKIQEIITEVFESACSEQFESIGCVVKSVKGESHSSEVVNSYIVAGSEDLSLSLLLKMPRLLLAQTMPEIDLAHLDDPEILDDWNNELANRFLGRVKNKLLRYNCCLQIGLPELLSETDLKHFKAEGDEIVRHFSVASELTESVIDCFIYVNALTPGYSLSQQSSIVHQSKPDGESELVFL